MIKIGGKGSRFQTAGHLWRCACFSRRREKETPHNPSPSYTWIPSSKVDAKLIMKCKSGELARLNIASQPWLAL